MARSIHITEFAETGNSTAGLPAGNFWEHWFQMQSPARPMAQSLDEHQVWEKAVGIGVLAIKESKR